MKSSRKLLICFVIISFISGCGTTIKTVITSDPQGANIYMGETPNKMSFVGITPKTFKYTNNKPYWKEWYYKISKNGYEDSELIHKLQGAINADRNVHATLKPLGEKDTYDEEKTTYNNSIVYTEGEYYLYSIPSLDSKILDTLEKGTKLTVIDKTEYWYKVQSPNLKTGWVAIKWFVKDGKREQQAVKTEEYTSTFYVKRNVTIYSRKNKGGYPVEPMRAGTKSLTVLKQDGDWINIRTPNGKVGWINEEWVVKDVNKTTTAEAKKELKHEDEDYPKKVYTNDEYYLYSEQAFEGQLIKTLDMGTILTVIQKDGNWYKIKTNSGEVGWVNNDWVTVDKAIIIKALEDKVRPIPAKNIKANFEIYNELLELDPNNKQYKDKVSYYGSKLEEEKLRKERLKLERKKEKERLRAVSDLELQNWQWGKEYGYVTAEGQVKNISGRKLTRVEALVTWYDKNGNMITYRSSLIEYDPILPGQSSPFKVMERYNPAMEKASIEFKHMWGNKIPFYRK